MASRAFCSGFRAAIGPAVISFGFLTILVGAPRSWAAKPDSVPDWVRAAARQTLPTYAPATNAVVLLDETTFTVAANGTATEHHRHAVKILRPQGREDGTVFVPFDSDSKVNSLHVWSIAPDGREFALKDSDIIESGYPGGGNFYEDIRAKIAQAPGRDPGGVVAYEYEQRMRPYLAETTWFFQDSLPHLSQSFTLELPPGYTFGTVWAHHPDEKPIDLEHQRYRWEMKSTSAVNLNDAPMSPSEGALAGRMTIHYSGPGVASATDGSWKSIGQWYQRLSQDRLQSTPEISAKAHELAGSSADFYDKTEFISEFVQKQIRYFVIERGIGGQQPHFAGEIFHNRYGDCKDKATLLSAMLSSVGIHSALMMVDSRRGVIDPEAPSIVGNHMIAAIQIPEGYSSPKLRSVVTARSGRRYLIFDPTWEKTPFGQLEHNLQGSFGVLMEGDASEIIRLPILAPELNTVRRTATMHLQPDGSVKGTVIERRFGDLAEHRRDLYTSGDLKAQTEFLDHQLRQDFSSFSVADFKAENTDALNKDLTTTYTLTSDRFAKSLGPLLMIRPRVIGSDALYLNRLKRELPIDLDQTMQATDNFDIELPPGYVVDEMPPPVKLDLGFASYESSSRVDGNTLHYSRTYTVREVTLPPDRYTDLQMLAGVIATDEQNNAILKKQ